MHIDIDRLVFHTLNKELKLSELSAVFSRGPLMRSLENLVNSGKVTCEYDGRGDYRYRAVEEAL